MTLFKRTLIFIVLLSVQLYNVKSENTFYSEAAIFAQSDEFFLHTVERGQTVYSISVMYKVKVDDIYRSNPDSKNGIKAGSVLKIPQISGSYYYHTIQPKETLYSVSKKYQMKGADIIQANPGLSIQTFTIGKTIRIPTNIVTSPMEGENENSLKRETEALLNKSARGTDIRTVKVALLLPFGLKEGTNSNNATDNRFVEYYEGFLMALEELKKSGISVELQVFDIGTGNDEIPEILKKQSMKNINLIIGGLTEKQIRTIASFAREKNIPYVIPFTSKSDEPLNNPQVFQINTPQSYLYSKASAAFCKEYKGSNVIFYLSDPDNEKMEFVKTLQADLTQNGGSFKTISSQDFSIQEIQKLLNPEELNIIIPSDDSSETLKKMLPSLNAINKLCPECKLSLFGYPGWQVYCNDYMEDYFKLQAGFYTIFYADPTSESLKSFYSNFNKWYSRELINTYPKFGILGYDTGMFFIKGLHAYGTAFDENVNNVKYKGIQIDFKFERVNNWGGFINTNIYLVSFNQNYSISKNTSK